MILKVSSQMSKASAGSVILHTITRGDKDNSYKNHSSFKFEKQQYLIVLWPILGILAPF